MARPTHTYRAARRNRARATGAPFVPLDGKSFQGGKRPNKPNRLRIPFRLSYQRLIENSKYRRAFQGAGEALRRLRRSA